METVKAAVQNCDGQHFIRIWDEGIDIQIPMSEDKPNAVKSAFNRIILRLKGGKFKIELEDVGEDLFSQVAREYIEQLNREITEIHGEMKQYGLLQARS